MDGCHFPGYKQCNACEEIVKDSEVLQHILQCRGNSVEEKECLFCLQRIGWNQLSAHLLQCDGNGKENGFRPLPPDALAPLINVDDTTDDEHDENEELFRTPEARTPSRPQSVENGSLSPILSSELSKVCLFCSKWIDPSIYLDHSLQCPFCSLPFPSSTYLLHLSVCSNQTDDPSSRQIEDQPPQSDKSCPFCSQAIDSGQYSSHLLRCSTDSSAGEVTEESSLPLPGGETKQCPFCEASMSSHLLAEHFIVCASDNEQTKRCLICSSSIPSVDYEDHLLSCSNAENLPSLTKKNNDETVACFTCGQRFASRDDRLVKVGCPSGHCHCWWCCTTAMKEFLQRGETPVCHRTDCSYPYSRSLIFIIPLPQSLFTRLQPLIRSEERLFCPHCHFYYSTDNDDDDDLHLCEELIRCEQCHLSYPLQEMSIHLPRCQADDRPLKDKLIAYLLPRTRYPLTDEQLRLYLERSPSSSLDPLQIVTHLAQFGSLFPYELPRRSCEICLDLCRYEDIFVFDCVDCHKCCYNCFLHWCRSKINGGEILTCVLCPTELRDGELNQLRLDEEQLKEIRDYQLNKTFNRYSARTRGILKCPRGECPWMAEATDPNERFQVTCLRCGHQFCSLCHQLYHYRTQCQQLTQLTQQWLLWCQTERVRYQRVRAVEDAEYANRLRVHQRENDQRNADLQRRYDELMRDEEYKANNCRLCPSCQRVVQRLEGCDTMICGQDAHGGNVQSGCGQRFNWTTAQPYRPTNDRQIRKQMENLPPPDHPRVHHHAVQCDRCAQPLIGIRFDCLHCPSLTYCEKCEEQATLEHSRDNPQHLFTLINNPQQ